MDLPITGSTKKYLLVFCLAAAVASAFAFYTDHRWEDWYITYRASRNMALGYGLVFNIGEHVHTFTSPLGTLLPALLHVIGKSDEFVLWGFRAVSIACYAGAAVVLLRIAVLLRFSKLIAGALIAIYCTHILIIDFSINGMETAFMVLLLALFAEFILQPGKRSVLQLGLLITLLMYTRPDSFIYWGSIGMGFFLFHPALSPEIGSRKKFALLFVRAGSIAALLYLPWIVITTLYYGTPVPHTIVAKSASMNYSVMGIVLHFLFFPVTLLINDHTAAGSLFAPPYSAFGGWAFLRILGKALSLICGLYFLLPTKNSALRAFSFGVYVALFYLFRISGQGGMPWYLPNVVITLILVLFYLLNQHFRNRRAVLIPAIAIVLAGNLIALLLGTRAIERQQQLVEFGNRKQIGLWLKSQAHSPRETVFLECLGYIGFYSGLKTYDYPGMSSPEVVASRKKNKSDSYAMIINDLRPDWLVLRPNEVTLIGKENPDLISTLYSQAKVFDVSDQIPDIAGRNNLLYDSKFIVFKKKG